MNVPANSQAFYVPCREKPKYKSQPNLAGWGGEMIQNTWSWPETNKRMTPRYPPTAYNSPPTSYADNDNNLKSYVTLNHSWSSNPFQVRTFATNCPFCQCMRCLTLVRYKHLSMNQQAYQVMCSECNIAGPTTANAVEAANAAEELLNVVLVYQD